MTAKTEIPQKSGILRDKAGRFALGCPKPAGSGRVKGQREDYLKVIRETATPEEIRKVTLAMLEAAKAGNPGAAKVLLAYTAGPPTPKKEKAEAQSAMARLLQGVDVKTLEATLEN